ncbi:MAG: polyphenol oxidase family protein [Acidimicrobiia bacterium]|nr:polyphenol oxidase family protein [Acidimicrobiia bacterium]
MIVSPGYPGVAFTTAADGDPRGNPADREMVSDRLGIGRDWAFVHQVHGSHVARATTPGDQGGGDALFTSQIGFPVAVFTADCFGVALVADGAVGVAHAGWRGIVAGVIPALAGAMSAVGFPPVRAAVGPGIGPCCYEVGSDVERYFPSHGAETTWGTRSVDLPGAVRTQLEDLEVWEAGMCTRCSTGLHSHRADSTPARMATIAWIC